MGLGKLAAVTDAGPLIHLTEIGLFHILSIFANLHIPDAVWAETVECGRISGEDILKSLKVKRHTMPQEDIADFIEKNRLTDLHSGECECLYISRQINVPILLIDDLAVREAAKRLKIVPVGSLGIIARAYYLGKILMADAHRHMLDLYEVSSLFVTRVIVLMAIDQLHNPLSS